MNNIREAIKSRGMTQEQVAKLLGVSRQAVQKWCTGSPPTVQNLTSLASILGVTVGYLSGTESSKDVQFVQDIRSPIVGDDFIRVPVLDVSGACAGDVVASNQDNAKIVSAVDFYRPFLRQQNGVTSLNAMEIIKYDSFVIAPQDYERTKVIGRVVYVFSGSPL